MKRKYVVILIVLSLTFFGSCSRDTFHSGESGGGSDNEGYYQDSLYDICFQLDTFLNDKNVEGIKSLLVIDLQEVVEDDALERIVDLIQDESISINPYNVKNITGLKKGFIDNKTVLYSDVEYFDVTGKSGNIYHIWIQVCNDADDESYVEGINYIRITNTTNDVYDVVSKIGYYYANNSYNNRD